MRARLRMLLEKRGYEVIVASDGVEALALLSKHKQIQFVLSDWVMPNMDGVALCQSVKSNDYHRYLFFMLLSSQDDHKSITLGINAGADDFVAKNTPVDELDARIRAGFRTLDLHNELVDKNRALNQAYAQINNDLLVASDLIGTLLPTEKAYSGVDIAYVYQPSAAIGGDMLGCIELDERYMAFYVFDVSGHGVASALLSFSIHHTLNTFQGESVTMTTNLGGERQVRKASEVLTSLNATYAQDDNHGLYATMVYAVLDRRTGELDVAFAGHPPLIKVNAATRAVERIGESGFVVGMFDFATYESFSMTLEAGDEVWFYTDGITEANVGKEMFGEEALEKMIATTQDISIQQKPGLIMEKVTARLDGKEFDDDVSLLVVRWLGGVNG
ncbi:SpoIIE family protein phosphatase [Vibrio sp. 10N]|nr:SpoIIE family protein phosphatase [Vibrio sp. 10N]